MSGQIALVTGAAGGIGSAIAAQLRNRGWRVVGLDVRTTTADVTRVVDLRDPSGIPAAMDEIQEHVGLPSALVNAAGVYRAIDLLATEPDYIRDVLNVNVAAPILLCRELIRRNIELDTAASIVNITSVVAHQGSADPSYGASKGALVTLTKSLAKAYGSQRIRVNAVAPGIIDTEMARSIPPGRIDHYRSTIPAGRFGLPEEVASAVTFLLSDEAAYVNGAILDVHGGLA
jgi:NAD(P)-dependent dehydrogenase (short-subunit alcohol dehydrogenase family)